MITLTYAVIANLFFGSGDAVRRLLADRRHQRVHAGVRRRHRRPIANRLYYIALAVAVAVYAADQVPRRARRSASRCRAFATSRCAWPRSATTSRCTGRSPSASQRSSPRSPASSTSGGTARSRRGDLGLGPTIDLLIIAVIGGLGRIEGAWIGAFAFIVINNYVANWVPTGGLPVVGGRFNTVIGLIFLAIVIVSPDGLMGSGTASGILARRRGGPPQVEVETREAGDRDELVVRRVEIERRLAVGSPLSW